MSTQQTRPTSTPTHRIERAGNLYVYHPIKPVRS